MAALLPARIPEAVMVTFGLTVQIFAALEDKFRLPVIELAAVAFKVRTPVEKEEAIFNAPVRLTGRPKPYFAACPPTMFKAPVPEFATILEAPT